MPGKRKDTLRTTQAEQELLKNYLFLQAVVDAVAEPIVVIGTDMRVKMYNREADRLSPSEKAGNREPSCHRLLFGRELPCNHAGQPCPFFEVLESEQPVTVEHRVKQQTGDLYYEILASPLRDEHGVLLGIIETVRDITERKRIELDLQKTHAEMERRVWERTADLEASCKILQIEVAERHLAEAQLQPAPAQRGVHR
jgi:PAS domain-containing protein